MKRIVLALPLACSLLSATQASAGANAISFVNNTDDVCNVHINHVYRATLHSGPSAEIPITNVWSPVHNRRLTILDPLAIWVWCSDGGHYALQLEAVKDKCVFTFDEEGNGITGQCTDPGLPPQGN